MGELGRLVGVVNRVYNRGLVSFIGSRFFILDYDFYICGIIFLVCFMVDIFDNVCGLFYCGDLYIILKDKVF